MNASLHRDNRKRDTVFGEFKNINNLHIPDGYPIKPTFFHHNGKYTSQIDYFLFDERIIQQSNPNVKIAMRHPTNTSDHTLVTANMALKVKRCSLRPVKIYTRPNWRKCDKSSYKSTIESSLDNTSGEKKFSGTVESRIQKLELTLHKAAKISQASKEAKSAHRNWIDKTNKNQDADQEKLALKNKKRHLRQLQRQAHASKKEKFINEIMQASEKDSKTFHKLIKQQRSNHSSNTDVLYIGNEKFEGESILKAWTIHFEKLGTPNHDKNIFDLERFHLAKLQNDIIFENQHSKKEIKQATPEEVKSAIKNLSTGKTSDENGICSEHYKYAVDELSEEIASIINDIFSDLDVPKNLKNGLLTPVLKKKKDKTVPGNYRGIVVTSIFSKIFESIVKGRLEYELLPSQNPLQRGFTEGASSLFAAFITTETILIYRLLQNIIRTCCTGCRKGI
ncbi:Hypothetical predicted protein [Mytilus galloprovincialis]|uniref:Reverse transcriptase domain-containing protein n=1 Tax=Mytilus galloprovincialis TaxID=29158 RepID=A0A8B6BK34_MYTGA|nr:Hypothetical predicted protein [Mytilus galloprovincialis]